MFSLLDHNDYDYMDTEDLHYISNAIVGHFFFFFNTGPFVQCLLRITVNKQYLKFEIRRELSTAVDYRL